ncbi:hypothetical protein Cgig2_004711 [Carnegiea gigantea]|uniref:Uncharacterized protein n=1 Tax=Carnegiea gigantea TaxID=171969 RepID=A0A9Q1JU58_9CARY|nr:hypothetical protein Cgig2_004711 [Carnegiea gigantea]
MAEERRLFTAFRTQRTNQAARKKLAFCDGNGEVNLERDCAAHMLIDERVVTLPHDDVSKRKIGDTGRALGVGIIMGEKSRAHSSVLLLTPHRRYYEMVQSRPYVGLHRGVWLARDSTKVINIVSVIVPFFNGTGYTRFMYHCTELYHTSELIMDLKTHMDLPWLVGGDFNEIFYHSERQEDHREPKRILILLETLSSIIICMTWAFWGTISHGAATVMEKKW